MSRRSTAIAPTNGSLEKGRKRTQRERLIAGMVAAANRSGYAGASVSAVIAEAGVSRPTFYDYFVDRDDCFLSAVSEIQAGLVASIRTAVEGEQPAQASHAALNALLSFATQDSAQALFLMNETMSAGPAALQLRDAGIAEIAEIVEQSAKQAASKAILPDVVTRVVIGGLYRWLATRLRRGERALTTHSADLMRWMDCYGQPASEERWHTLKTSRALAPSPFLPNTKLRPPPPLPPGRPRVSEQEVAENHRLRIMFAAAQLGTEKGFNATTIGDLTKVAGVDTRAFYARFASKQDAFMAAHELGFQEVMAVTACAFFTAASWPERSWEAGRAFTQFLEKNPAIAYMGFVEAYTLGAGATQRVEDSHIAFTIFLQEGVQNHPQENPLSRAALEAVITTIFELVYLQIRAGAKLKLSGLLGHMAYLWLAPFLGSAEANRFIEAKVGECAEV